MQCCKEDAWFLHELPFKYDLIFDYYDGVLKGFTSCVICGQGYYYKLLAWDEATQDCRVYNFFEIPFTGEQLAESLGIKKILREHGGLVPPPHIHDFSFSPPPATHICTSENSFKTGFWRRRVASDDEVTDWVKYLGLIPPND